MEILPEMMKKKEAGLSRNSTPLLRAMVIHREPMAISVMLSRETTAAVMFSSAGGRQELIGSIGGKLTPPQRWRLDEPMGLLQGAERGQCIQVEGEECGAGRE